MFTPFMWMILFQFFKNLYHSLRIRKNAVIKRSDEFLYYRGELDHVSPGVLMFVSGLAFDMKKSIAATILKLKHLGYIQEKEGEYICLIKDEPKLMKSESMVLQLVQNRAFDKALYRKTIEKEAVRSRYLTLNRGGTVFRIVKMLTAVCIPVVYFIFTIWLDGYGICTKMRSRISMTITTVPCMMAAGIIVIPRSGRISFNTAWSEKLLQ